MQTHARKNVLTAVALILVGSAGIQTSSAISASLFGALGPFGTSALRMVLAAIVIMLLVRPKIHGRPKEEWAGIAIYGIAMTMMNLCLYVAISRLPLGIAVTLDFLGPCAVALIASRRFREGVCAIVSLGGVALISLGPSGYFDLIGYVAGLGAAIFFGLYTLFASKIGKTGNGLDGLALSITISAICTLPISLVHVQQVTAPQWGALAMSAVIGVVIPYTVDTIAGRITSARIIGTLFAIDPAMGALIGFLMLGQSLSMAAVGGIILVAFSGAALVWLSEKSPGTAPSPKEPMGSVQVNTSRKLMLSKDL